MSNVVPFKSRPRNLIVTVDCSTPLEEGDLIAMQLSNGRALLVRWFGPTGRDWQGRFVKKGSAEECYETDFIKYCALDLARGHLKILGSVNESFPL